jgi:hypothetical protein
VAVSNPFGNISSVNKTPYDSFYKVTYSNWYSSLPYAFKAIINGKHRLFFLPINPQNLTITTHYATNVVTTLYSTVEEHSDQRYFDISIQGTTGFAPQYVGEQNVVESPTFDPNTVLSSVVGFVNPAGKPKVIGRSAYQSGEVLSGLAGGFFQKTLGQVDQALNRASDAWNTIQGKTKPFQAGVFQDNSGYLAFHNLYRFFLEYKKSAASGKSTFGNKQSSIGNSIKDLSSGTSIGSLLSAGAQLVSSMQNAPESPMVFINYKDCNQYSCAIQRFTLERSAENPMLYNYNIQLRAYDIKPLTGVSKTGLVASALERAGLGASAPSLAARLKGGVRNAKQAVNAMGGAFGSLGK